MDYRRMAQMTEIFRDGKIHPLEQLEAELNLGNRMVRKLLGELNQELLEYQASICAKRGEGYYLLTENEQLFRQFEEKLRRINQQSEELPNSAQERIRFLIGFLLRTDDYVKMDMLCDQLYVSRSDLPETWWWLCCRSKRSQTKMQRRSERYCRSMNNRLLFFCW